MSKIKILLILSYSIVLIFALVPEFVQIPENHRVKKVPEYLNLDSDFYSREYNQSQYASELPPAPLAVSWQAQKAAPAALYRTAGACDTSGHFYIIGGQDGTNVSQNRVYKYFADGDSWRTMANLPDSLSNSGAAFNALTNRIYVFGGYTGSADVNTCYYYQVEGDSWVTVSPLFLSMLGTYAASIDSFIYYTGSDVSGTSIGLWKINCITNTHYYITTLPGGGASGMAASDGLDNVYFVGAWPSKDTVARYVRSTNSVAYFCQMPIGLHGLGAEVINNKLYMYNGGQSWNYGTNGVYSYDLSRGPGGTWYPENPTISARFAGTYGAMFYQDSWRLHSTNGSLGYPNCDTLHEQGSIPPIAIDAKLLKINQPSRSPIPNSSVPPNVTIMNNGMRPITNIPVTIWIYSAGTRIYNQSQTNTAILNPNDTANITFSPNFNISGPGVSYGITAFTNLAGDIVRTNDTLQQLTYIPGLIWTELPSAPETTYACAGCGDTSGHFYVLGGFVNGNRSSNNWLYDEITRTWIIKQNLPFPAATFYAAYDFARNRIFCLGGTSPNSLLQIYHADEDTWTIGFIPPITSVGPCAIIGDTLYSFGSKLHRYHIPTNYWDSGISIPGYLYFCGICTYGQEIYFSGGYPANPSVYKYTLETNTWTQLPDLPVGRHSHGMEVIDDKIVVFGGGQVWSPLNSVYVLDPHYPQAGWAPESSMVFGQMSAATGVVKINGMTRLHVACGYSDSAISNEHQAASFQVTNIEETNSSYITKSLLKVMPTLSKHNIQIKVINYGKDNGNLIVFDNCGRLIRKFSPILGKGEFTIIWDKTDDKGISVSPSVYFILFDKRGERLTEKVIIIE